MAHPLGGCRDDGWTLTENGARPGVGAGEALSPRGAPGEGTLHEGRRWVDRSQCFPLNACAPRLRPLVCRFSTLGNRLRIVDSLTMARLLRHCRWSSEPPGPGRRLSRRRSSRPPGTWTHFHRPARSGRLCAKIPPPTLTELWHVW